jgi:nucleoside-diphosphate-sugar epimerase
MILVTGTTGFIGHSLLKLLVEVMGKDQVLAFTSKPISICQYLLHNDYHFDNDLFIKQGFEDIETIIHAGAFTPKSAVDSNNVEQSNSNIFNTYRLISANFPSLKRFIFLSTLDVYAHDAHPITELSPVDPVSLYGHSKLYCEKMVTAWADRINISCHILRIGHVYGPGEEKYQKLIPMVMQQILNNDPIKLFGKGDDIRTFIYISDVVQSIIKALDLQAKNEVINVVGHEQICIRDLIDKIIQISGKEVPIQQIETDTRPRHLIFDDSKMKRLLSSPSTPLATGLKMEWDYFKQL